MNTQLNDFFYTPPTVETLSKLKKSMKVLPFMCKQQKRDLQSILDSADSLVEAATSMMTHGGMSYNSLIEARKDFQKLVIETASRYRSVIETEEDPEE